VESDVDSFTERIKTRLVKGGDEAKLSEKQETKIRALFKEFVLLKGKKVKFKDIFKDKNLETKYYDTMDEVKKVFNPKQLEAYRDRANAR